MVERERAEHPRALRDEQARLQEELVQRERENGVRQETIVDLNQKIAGLGCAWIAGAGAGGRTAASRTEESVTWQAFQKARARLYGDLGEGSLLSRVLGLSLRLAGRALITLAQEPPSCPRAMPRDYRAARVREPEGLADHPAVCARGADSRVPALDPRAH